MASKLSQLAMAQVLQEVPDQMHRLPDILKRQLTNFFFEEMFERDAETARNLALWPNLEQFKKLMSTFANINFNFYTSVDEEKIEDLEDASAYFIYNVGDFLHLLGDDSLEVFLKFLEGLIITFHDSNFRLLDSEDYDLEVRLFFLKEPIMRLIFS